MQLPESISDDTPGLGELPAQSYKLVSKSRRSLKVLVISLTALFVGVTAWEIGTAVTSLFAFNAVLGIAASLLVLFIVYKALAAMLSLWRHQREFSDAQIIQLDAETLRQNQSFGHSKALIKRLEALYEDKPQADLLRKALDGMPDYNNDNEAINHISQHFLAQLDKAAMQRISSYSQQTAAMVAISPWATMDMLIALWRSVRMVDEISQIYGFRPSLIGRWVLIKKLMHQLAFAGLAEVLSDRLATLPSNKMLGIVSAAGAQGLGAGIYTARIGIYAMRECRPILFTAAEKPSLKDIVKRVANFLKSNTEKAEIAA